MPVKEMLIKSSRSHKQNHSTHSHDLPLINNALEIFLKGY